MQFHLALSFTCVLLFSTMAIPNKFLSSHVEANCFCGRCRIYRLDIITGIGYTINELHNLFTRELVEEEEERLDRLYQATIQLIIYGKAYKESCLRNTGYTYFKSWAKTQPEFEHLTTKNLQKFCDRVKKASTAFDQWDIIVKNLTDIRMTYIDARRFSVAQFWEARSLAWCLNYNENLRPKGKNHGEKSYPEDKYQLIFQQILNSGILDDIDNDPQIASCIGGRLQSDMVRRANSRYRPY